jgi:hypothetical protein
VRVAYALALRETGDEKGALEAILEAREQVLARAARVTDEHLRRSFLGNVRANALTLRLADEWSRAAPR